MYMILPLIWFYWWVDTCKLPVQTTATILEFDRRYWRKGYRG